MNSIKEFNGLNISYFGGRNSLLLEKYGILDRDSKFKELLQLLANIYSKLSFRYNQYEKEDVISNLTEWLHELKIIINFTFPFDAVFDINDNFKLNSDKTKVESAVIKINPTNIHKDDMAPMLYHEIKHIYDYMILKTDSSLKENLFRDFIYNHDINLIQYLTSLILLLDNMPDIMNFIGNILLYVEKSECSTYLENIDLDYKQALNDNLIIFDLLYNGYKLNQIKTMLRYNASTTNYIVIYTNIRSYITELLNNTSNFTEIDSEYKNMFKDVYNANNFKSVLNIYLKRIDKVIKTADKLFTDRYLNSYLYKLINNKLT